jgi:hypothetical protein
VLFRKAQLERRTHFLIIITKYESNITSIGLSRYDYRSQEMAYKKRAKRQNSDRRPTHATYADSLLLNQTASVLSRFCPTQDSNRRP